MVQFEGQDGAAPGGEQFMGAEADLGLHAAAAEGAGDLSVAIDAEHRAGRLRRGAAGGHDGAERGGATGVGFAQDSVEDVLGSQFAAPNAVASNTRGRP